MYKPRIYLDNCCYSRLFDNFEQLNVRKDAEAVLFILDEIEKGTMELVWSYVLDLEIDDNPIPEQQEFALSWRDYATEYIDKSEEVLLNAGNFRRLGIRPMDALHVACAVVATSDFFITTDRGILKKQVKEIKIINPKEYVHFYKEKHL